MTKIRLILFLITIIIVGTFSTFIGYYARGYRFDTATFSFQPRGLLVIKSVPDGAQIYLNGELETATNATISLTPDVYDVSVKKEGFLDWNKRLTIQKEVVTEAEAHLFKSVPSLSAITFSGVSNPSPDKDSSKIAYLILPETGLDTTKVGLWVIETVNLPLGFSRDPIRVTDGDLSGATFSWSPNSREILLETKTGLYLLNAGQFTTQNSRVNVASGRAEILAEWEAKEKQKLNAQIKSLPDPLKEVLERRVDRIVFSPDETKILYSTIDSGKLPDDLIKPFTGSSTQTQEREIKAGRVYVYDIREDRNFLVDEEAVSLLMGSENGEERPRRMSWFPTSEHLVLAKENEVIVMDLDGTNHQTVYSGSYLSPHAFATLNKDRLLILTNLGGTTTPNLYSLSLR